MFMPIRVANGMVQVGTILDSNLDSFLKIGFGLGSGFGFDSEPICWFQTWFQQENSDPVPELGPTRGPKYSSKIYSNFSSFFTFS